MKELLEICIGNVFQIWWKTYTKVEIGSSIAPVLAEISMVELNRTLASKLTIIIKLLLSKLYFIKIGLIEYILWITIDFHEKIRFTYQFEKRLK